MGKSRIFLTGDLDYTNINATQIRRDLSAFGKFGKAAGYNIDSLLGEIRKILRTQGQHNIVLVRGRATRRGDRRPRRSSPSTAFISRRSWTPTPRRWGGRSATSR